MAEHYRDKLAKIKVFLCDVDGVLTDGKVYWASDEVGFNRTFHVSDGYGLKVLREAGIRVGVISGGDSVGLRKRVENLNLEFAELGDEDKRSGLKRIVEATGADLSEILYMGDEFFDIPLLKVVGFSATVPHASSEVKESCDYITFTKAGEGCVREVIDMLRHIQGITPEIPEY